MILGSTKNVSANQMAQTTQSRLNAAMRLRLRPEVAARYVHPHLLSGRTVKEAGENLITFSRF